MKSLVSIPPQIYISMSIVPSTPVPYIIHWGLTLCERPKFSIKSCGSCSVPYKHIITMTSKHTRIPIVPHNQLLGMISIHNKKFVGLIFPHKRVIDNIGSKYNIIISVPQSLSLDKLKRFREFRAVNRKL